MHKDTSDRPLPVDWALSSWKAVHSFYNISTTTVYMCIFYYTGYFYISQGAGVVKTIENFISSKTSITPSGIVKLS